MRDSSPFPLPYPIIAPCFIHPPLGISHHTDPHAGCSALIDVLTHLLTSGCPSVCLNYGSVETQYVTWHMAPNVCVPVCGWWGGGEKGPARASSAPVEVRQAVSQQPTSLLVSSGHYGSSACSIRSVRHAHSGLKFAVRFSTYNGFISSQFVEAIVQKCLKDLKLACTLALTLM